MKMLKTILGALFFTAITPAVIAQCNLTTTPTTITVDCGTPINISALGLSPTPALATTFDGGTIGAGWSSSASVLYTNPCGPTLDGTPAAWFGNVPFPRTLTTNGFDLSCGAQICFDLDFAADDGGAHCEDPDQPDEGVYFDYSTDGGATWITMYYFDPQPNFSAGTNPVYEWANYCFTLPQSAWGPNVMFRWDQPQATTQSNDHWGIDNVVITPIDCNFWYDWSHVPGFPDDPNQTVTPGSDTTFYVTYTDGVTVCLDSVVVTVNPLVIDIVGNPNPVDCGSCSDLQVEFLNGNNGSIVDDFEGGPDPLTWGDIQSGTSSTICGGGATGDALYFDGSGAERYAETLPVDATSCGNIDFCLFMGNTASGGAPCENNEPGDDVVLEYSTDNGASWTTIALYDESQWDGPANNAQICFSETMPVGAQTSSTIFRWRQVAFFPTSGSDNWSLDDVNISCNPPTITYNWTTGTVDDPTSPTPVACPGANELYTVFMENSLTGCNSSDTSTLFVNECQCFFMDFTGDVVCQPGGVFDVTGTFEYSYSPTTGTIEVEATNGTGTYSQSFNAPFTDSTVFNYTIAGIPNDGSTTTMYIYFSDSLSCNMTFDLTPPVLPTVTSISGGDTYCAGDPVSPILVDVTGTGPWTVEYTVDGVPNTATAASSPIDLGTAPGVYVLTGVADQVCLNAAAGTETITVNPLPTVGGGADQALCDGETTVLSGTGATTYVWDNGVTDGATFTPPVGTTTYTVTGTDANGCVSTGTVNIDVTAYPAAPGVGPQGGEYCSSFPEIPPFLASGAAQNFQWYSDPNLTIPIGSGPSLQPFLNEGNTDYYVTQSLNGCESAPSMVSIFLDNCEATIVMPNVFTPNTSDDINGLFHPVFMDGVLSAETTILNRWGNVIYQTDDLDIDWDGTSNGKDVQEGTYFWKMVYRDLNGEEFMIHGNIQLIR